jgi:nucleotide-binding universal stress UspA family protein
MSHATSSVAVVRPKSVPAANVAVGLACNGSDRLPLEFAAGLASAEGVALDAVHVWHAVDSLENLLSPAQRLETMALHERALSETLAGVGEKFPDVQVNRHLPEGRIAETLVKATAEADCLVLGARERVGTRMFVGSVSRSVVEHASATVVVVRH